MHLAKAALRVCDGLTPGEQRLVRAGQRALVHGEPVSCERLAHLAELTTSEVARAFERLPGLARLDAQGRVVGLLGLSSHCGVHRLEAAGRSVSTWCAWDSLFIPRIIGMTARVASHCPVMSALILLVVEPDGVRHATPPDVRVSFLLGCDDRGQGVIGVCCPHIHFLSSARAAELWLADHSAGSVLTLEEAWEVGRLFVDEVLFGVRGDALLDAR